MLNILLYLRRSWILYGLLLSYFTLLLLNSFGIGVWLPSCPISAVSGKECLGCGMNHAFIDILNGEFQNAFDHNPLIFLWLPLIVGWITLDYIKFSKSINSNSIYDI